MAFISYASHKGYIEINPQNIPNELKRRRIIIQDLDEKGNVIGEKMVNESDKDIMLSSLVSDMDLQF